MNKVLLVTGIYPPDIGGPATYIPILEKELKKRKVEVTVLSLSDNAYQSQNQFPDNFFVSRQRNKILRVAITVAKIIKLSIGRSHIFANGLFEESAIASLFLRKKIFVAKVVGDPIWERSKNSKKTNLNFEDFQREKLKLFDSIQRKLLVWSLNRFNRIICPGIGLRNSVTNWGVKSEIFYIPNGVEIPKTLHRNKKTYDFITVSRLVPWKNIEFLISYIGNSSMRLLVVGDGPELHNLKNLAEAKNANVDFIGHVSSDKVVNFMRQSRYFVQLSSYEGMSFSLLQALSIGMVVIVSDCQGNANVITNNVDGFLIPLDDLNSIGEVLKKVDNSPEVFKQISSNARNLATNKFSIDENVKSTLEVCGLLKC